MEHKNIRESLALTSEGADGPPIKPSEEEGCQSTGMNQAGSTVTVKEIDPFQRRESLTRTPPGDSTPYFRGPEERRQSIAISPTRSTSEVMEAQMVEERTTDDKHDIMDLEDVFRKTKRKRVETPEKTKINDEERDLFLKKIEVEHNMLKELMRKTSNEIEFLRKAIVEIPNTKKEIKKSISTLFGYSKRTPTAINFITEMKEQLIELVKDKGGAQSKQVADTYVQTVGKRQEEKNRLVERIENQLKKELDGEELQDLMQLKWPEEVYHRCKIRKDEETKWEEQDQIIVIRAEEDKDDKILKRALHMNPHLERALNECEPEPGKIICSVSKNGIMGEDDIIKSSMEKYTYLIVTKEGGKTMQDKIDLKVNLGKVVDIARKNGRTKTICTVTNQTEESSVRKLLEYVCRKENSRIDMYKNKSRRYSTLCNTEEGEMEDVRKKGNKNEDIIILKPRAGMSYTDVIKGMRKEVDTKGILVDRINKTSGGNVKIKIKGKEEKDRKAFRKLLGEKMVKVAQVDFKTRKQTVMILDIQETIEVTEVREIIQKEIGEIDVEWELKMAEKSNRNGVKYAFLTTDKEAAQKLLAKKRIGERWDRWRVREIDVLPRCYKCQKVGHIAKECKEAAANEACYKCGESGHQVKDCQNEQICYLCTVYGHKAETMSCPKYRELVKKWKKEQRGGPAKAQ